MNIPAEDEYVTSGVYDDVPEHVYHSLPGISNSMLKTFAESEHLYEAKYIKKTLPDNSTKSTELGSYFHALLLEPNKCEHFICKFKTSNSAGGTKERIEARDNGLYPVTLEQHDEANRMRDSVHKNALAAAVLRKGNPEQSLFSVHEPTGLRIRSRIDWRDTSRKLVSDIKTTRSLDPRPNKLPADILNYRWHVQEAFYTDIERQLGNEIEEFIWILVENKPPYACIAAPISDRAKELGRKTYNDDMNRLKICLDSDKWQVYDYPIDHDFRNGQGLDLPFYAYPRE